MSLKTRQLSFFILLTFFFSSVMQLSSVAEAKPVTKPEVRAWYKNVYLPPMMKDLTWNGSVSGCDAGNLGKKKVATYGAQVNAIRSYMGLTKITMETSKAVQKTALMMHAQDSLSHYPSITWKCYSLIGAAAAARSNLALSYQNYMGAALELYMDEPGANEVVGHRRWVFLPEAQVFRVGATDRAQALEVIGVKRRNDYANPRWVSWPRQGAFPSQLEPQGRWSLSSGNPNFRWVNPTVRVWRNGEAVRNVKVHSPAYGYGRPTLVWDMPGEVQNGTYQVKVFSGASGDRRKVSGYRVKMFTA